MLHPHRPSESLKCTEVRAVAAHAPPWMNDREAVFAALVDKMTSAGQAGDQVWLIAVVCYSRECDNGGVECFSVSLGGLTVFSSQPVAFCGVHYAALAWFSRNWRTSPTRHAVTRSDSLTGLGK